MKSILINILILLLLSCQSNQQKQTQRINQQSASMVSSWNQKLIETAVREDGLLTLKGVRTATMMHLAMHDALNLVVPRYKTYSSAGLDLEADPVVAMIEAAYVICNEFYPESHEAWLAEKMRWLDDDMTTKAKNRGKQLGRSVARTIIQNRANDRWNGETEYQWHPMAPGVYAEFNEHSGTPKGFIFGAGWANVQPFALTSSQQFLSPAPPQINSEEYTKAFNEVKELGRYQSTVRTEDQTHLALWWKEFSEISHNKLARELVQQQDLGLLETSRLFALLNMSIFDAYVNVFYNKFHYNHWRPYSAIMWAENDGNPDTEADLTWTNTHQHTYAFPSYPSAHGTACTAAMQAIAEVFGDDMAFTMTTSEVDSAGPFSEKMTMEPTQRSFRNFSEAAMECSMSRVYLGIHFRYDSIEGNKLGAKIGNYVVMNYMNKLK
ncbi:MAG: vanadium-dependent haloperoxidase [Marinicella sp.]